MVHTFFGTQTERKCLKVHTKTACWMEHSHNGMTMGKLIILQNTKTADLQALGSIIQKKVNYFLNKKCNNLLLKEKKQYFCPRIMVPVVQLVRASDCGSESRGFESHRAPHKKAELSTLLFLCPLVTAYYWKNIHWHTRQTKEREWLREKKRTLFSKKIFSLQYEDCYKYTIAY